MVEVILKVKCRDTHRSREGMIKIMENFGFVVNPKIMGPDFGCLDGPEYDVAGYKVSDSLLDARKDADGIEAAGRELIGKKEFGLPVLLHLAQHDPELLAAIKRG